MKADFYTLKDLNVVLNNQQTALINNAINHLGGNNVIASKRNVHLFSINFCYGIAKKVVKLPNMPAGMETNAIELLNILQGAMDRLKTNKNKTI